jgi:PleD family two-component response regulator
MTDFRLRFRRHLRAEPESIFSVLHSFAGLSTSVGMVTAEPPIDSLDDLLQEADQLMYRAKWSGGNHIVGSH